MLSRQVIRRFTTTAIRRHGDPNDGVPGSNLPFDSNNKYKLTLIFTLFFGSGFATPCLIARHQLLKD